MTWIKAYCSPNEYLPYHSQCLEANSVASVPPCEMRCLGLAQADDRPGGEGGGLVTDRLARPPV